RRQRDHAVLPHGFPARRHRRADGHGRPADRALRLQRQLLGPARPLRGAPGWRLEQQRRGQPGTVHAADGRLARNASLTVPDPLPSWDFGPLSVPPPPPIVPTPAVAHRSVRGRRVVIGLPGLGWRADMRADSPVVQGSRTYVPVLPEQEWYRAEAEQIEAFAPMVPIERVWVEAVAGPSPVEHARAQGLGSPPRVAR